MEGRITPFKIGLKYGGYLGLSFIIVTLIAHYSGWEKLEDLESTLRILVEAVLGLGITMIGIVHFRNENEGLLTFGEGFSVALFTGVFAGVIGAIFLYIFATYIAPDVAEELISSVDMEEFPEMEDDDDHGSEFSPTPVLRSFARLMSTLLLSVIYGLIGSIILKKG